MKRYYNIVTVIITFLAGAIAKDWIVYEQIKYTEEWFMDTQLVMIHSTSVTFLVYGFLGGWFVSGLLAAVSIWLDWYAKLIREGKIHGAIISLAGALVVGIFGFLPYAIINTRQYGICIFSDRKQKNDLNGMKKDIAGTVFMICGTVILLIMIRCTWHRSVYTIIGGALICGFIIFEGIRKIHEIDEQINRNCMDEEHIVSMETSPSGKWDLMQSNMEGLSIDERLNRMCEHISNYIPYYLAEKEWIGVTVEGGYFLEKRSDGTEAYLYILRAKDDEGYISEKSRKVWEYWILLGDYSSEGGHIEDLTEEWMNEFMSDFYEKLNDLYNRKKRKSAKGIGRPLQNVKIYTC